MFRFVLKRRGAISVFLVVVLVPMLVMSATMVDVSRVNLGNAMAVSAGDLTANTVLTNYDYQLKKMYGLLASSNNTKDFLDKMEGFYCDTIMAGGIDKDTAATWAKQLRGSVSSTDLQNIAVEENSFKLNVLQGKNGSLMNPAITKTQIVNFMKYRGPVNMGTSIFDAVSLFKSMGKKTDMVEKKNEYYEEHAKIIEECQKARDCIGNYEREAGISQPEDFPNEAAFREMRSNLGISKASIEATMEDYVRYIYSYEFFRNAKEIDLSYEKSSNKWEWTTCMDESITTNKKATVQGTQKIIDDLDKYMQNSNQYKKYSTKGIENKINVNYLEQFFREYSENKGLLHLCIRLMQCLKGLNEDKKLKIDGEEVSVKDFLEDKNNKYFHQLNSILKKYDRVYQRYHAPIQEQKNNLDNVIAKAKKQGEDYYGLLSDRIGWLDGNESDTGLIKHLEKIENLIDSLSTKLDKWENSASVSQLKKDTQAQSDKKEIERIRNTFDKSQITELKNKVKRSSETLKKIRDCVQKYKIGEWSFSEMNPNSSSLQKAMDNKFGNQIYYPTESEMACIAAEAKEIVKQPALGEFVTSWSDDSHPDLRKQKEKSFYTYLVKNYTFNEKENKTDKQKQKVENKKNDYKKEAEKEKQKEGVNTSNSVAGMKNRPSQVWTKHKGDSKALGDITEKSTNQKKALSNSTNIMNNMFQGVSEKLKGARDNFYVSDYMLEMFSYSTIEKEEAPEDRKTLTKMDINTDNNYLYGKEVEYIIYGGDNGVAKAYASIYGIRFASNLVYAFTDKEITATATAIATSVFGAPPLTALVPMAKIAIVVGLALVESGIDIAELSNGKAVPLYKSSSTWVAKPSSAAGKVVDKVKTIVVDVGETTIDAGTKILNDWLSKTSDKLVADIDAKGKEFSNAVGEIVKENVDNYVGQVVDQLVSICSNAVNQEKNKRVGYVKEKLKQWSDATDFGSAITNQIKEQAVNYVVTQCEVKINNLINGLQNGGDKAKEKVSDIINQLNDNIEKVVASATGTVTNMTNELTEKLKKSATQGAEKMKQTLKSEIEGKFGSSTSGETSASDTVTGSLLSWKYSDYLRMFTVIGLITNEETMLLRMEDLIQKNMELKKGTFSLASSYVYYEMQARILVKPLLTTVPFINEYTKDRITGTNWYTIDYKTRFGY